MLRHDYGPIFWLHGAVIVVFYASPFLFDAWYIILGAALFYLQYVVLGDCVLSQLQFRQRRTQGFFRYYFQKWQLADPDAMIRVIDRTRPVFILLAVVLQWGFGYEPLLI